MRVLILHDLMAARPVRRQLVNQTYFFPKYRPAAEIVQHAAGDSVDDALRHGEFDAIFLDVTFLCWRWAKPASVFAEFLGRYAWVADHPSVKVAFPQDDYDHHAVLDEWLAAWKVDLVFSPLPAFADVLYPLASRTGRILPFLTGFVDDVDLAIAERGRLPIAERSIDLAYRARPLPPGFGEVGRLKTQVGEVVGPVARRAGLVVDVSTDPADTIFGDGWLTFLGSARHVLGTPSGSSVIDPRGEIGAAIAAFIAAHPGASFDEITLACVPPDASRYRMEALSPRVFETALARACQVLVRGEYGPLEPDRHYIPIEPDFSNVEAVVARLRDHDRAQRIADDCFALVTSAEELHYRHAAKEVRRAVVECWQARGDTDRARRIARTRPVATAEAVERVLSAEVRGRQALLDGLAGQLASATTGDAIQVSRFNELGLVVADRWGRLADHAAIETERALDGTMRAATEAARADAQAARADFESAQADAERHQAAILREQLRAAEARIDGYENASIVRLARMMAKRILKRLHLR